MKQPLIMLVGPAQAACAFLIVQLRRLVPRGHKPNQPKRQRAPFRLVRLMLVGPAQAACAFLFTTDDSPWMQEVHFESCR